MQVVPVMDLKGGRAVHAAGGDRARYRVVEGVLGSGADPLALAAAVRERLGCRSLYLADLDAIEGAAPALELLGALAARELDVWCDAGACSAPAAERLLGAGAGAVVVGLETLRSLDPLRDVVRAVGAPRVIFSLDLRDGRPVAADPALAALSPADLARAAVDAGVQRMICLDLARVGSRAGPPLALLAALGAAAPSLLRYAGGGVRAAADLDALAAAGCAGALVATALHDGRIGRAELERLHRPDPTP